MKRIIALLLTMAMLLSMSAASAEVYVSGAVTDALISDAFASGKRIAMSSSFTDVQLDAAALGLTQEEADAVAQEVSGQQYEVGIVAIEEGVRIDADIAQSGVTLDFVLDITTDGLRLQSESLMPGKAVTIGWKALLMELDVDEEIAQTVADLIKSDWDELAPQLAEEIDEMVAAIGAAFVPYGEAVLAYIGTLEPQLIADVPAEARLPYAEQALVYTITGKEAAGLLSALLDVLEQDSLVLPYFAQGFREGMGLADDVTDEQICSLLRSLVSQLAQDTSAVYCIMGLDADANVRYALIQGVTGSEQLRIYAGQNVAGDGIMAYATVADASTGAETDGFIFEGSATEGDTASVKGSLTVIAEGEQIDFVMAMAMTPTTTADALPGAKTEIGFSMTGMGMNAILYAEENSHLTADGGEAGDMDMGVDMSVDGTSLSISATGSKAVTPLQDGHFTSEQTMTVSMPMLGITGMTQVQKMWSEDYAGLAFDGEVIALEDASSAQLEELAQMVSENLDALMGTVGVSAVEM